MMASSESEAMKFQRKQAELLCFGFLRDASSPHLIIPEDIISTLCVRYFLLRIDYFKGHSASYINEKDNTFSSTDSSSVFSTYAIAQCGWSRGCHEMSIKVVQH